MIRNRCENFGDGLCHESKSIKVLQEYLEQHGLASEIKVHARPERPERQNLVCEWQENKRSSWNRHQRYVGPFKTRPLCLHAFQVSGIRETAGRRFMAPRRKINMWKHGKLGDEQRYIYNGPLSELGGFLPPTLLLLLCTTPLLVLFAR